jgi:hypothetical protein
MQEDRLQTLLRLAGIIAGENNLVLLRLGENKWWAGMLKREEYRLLVESVKTHNSPEEALEACITRRPQ